MTRWLAAALALPVLVSACDECAGTPSCHNFPEISATGQFIDRKSGEPVANVGVAFVPKAGIDVIGDTIRTVSDADGHFTFRVGSIYNGTAVGDLIVSPPPPFKQYVISGITLETSQIRGEGAILGRLVVNPYLLLVGHVRDRKTHTPLPNVEVRVRRIGGGEIDPSEGTFTTDFGGQFSWDPEVVRPDTVVVEFEMTAPGRPRPYVVQRKLPMLIRDGEMRFTILPVGYGLAYIAATSRRGSGDQLPVTVEWVRVGGITTTPSQATVTADPGGFFPMPLEPRSEGLVTVDLRIIPPPPIPPETSRVVLRTGDDDVPEFLGFFRYGAQVITYAELRDVATGEPLPPTTGVTMQHVGGVPLAWRNPIPGGDLLAVSDSGTILYLAPTADSGTATFDMIVRHPPPYIPDTIRNLTFPARYTDSAHVAGVISVRRRTSP